MLPDWVIARIYDGFVVDYEAGRQAACRVFTEAFRCGILDIPNVAEPAVLTRLVLAGHPDDAFRRQAEARIGQLRPVDTATFDAAVAAGMCPRRPDPLIAVRPSGGCDPAQADRASAALLRFYGQGLLRFLCRVYLTDPTVDLARFANAAFYGALADFPADDIPETEFPFALYAHVTDLSMPPPPTSAAGGLPSGLQQMWEQCLVRAAFTPNFQRMPLFLSLYGGLTIRQVTSVANSQGRRLHRPVDLSAALEDCWGRVIRAVGRGGPSRGRP